MTSGNGDAGRESGPFVELERDAWAALGAATEETPWGPFVTADPMGRTSVPGLLIAGNASSGSANVPVAMAAGTMAGAMANADMVTEDVAIAVAAAAAAAAAPAAR